MWTPEAVHIIEVGCPCDGNVVTTQKMKAEKYVELAHDLRTSTGKAVRVTSVVIGNTGLVAEGCKKYVEDLDIGLGVAWLQKIATVETIKIVQTLLR